MSMVVMITHMSYHAEIATNFVVMVFAEFSFCSYSINLLALPES